MKKMKRILCTVLAVCMLTGLLTTMASATERSSAYLDGYRAFLTAKGNGRVSVTVDVRGTNYMTDIGAETIYIYESTDNAYFTLVATYEAEDYPDMMGSGSFYYETPIIHRGTAGRYYFAVVDVYAGNANGGHTRQYETVPIRAT